MQDTSGVCAGAVSVAFFLKGRGLLCHTKGRYLYTNLYEFCHHPLGFVLIAKIVNL